MGLLEIFLESDEEITKVCCFFVACRERNIFVKNSFKVGVVIFHACTVVCADIEFDIPLFCVEEFFFCVDVYASV